MTTICDLCKKKETLQHILNNCPVMLEQGRYTRRHNSVLRSIFDNLKETINPSWVIYCDLVGATKSCRDHHPPDILSTQQRPDIVLVNRDLKSTIIIELTIPFEQNIRNALHRKINRYSSLLLGLQELDYDTKLFCIEVGSRGLINDENKCNIQMILKAIQAISLNNVCAKTS